MVEENNNIFLAGGEALVYLAEPMHKKYSRTFVPGHPFSTYVCSDQSFNPAPSPQIRTFEYRIHWNINIREKIIYEKTNGGVGWNKQGSSVNQKPESTMSVILCTGSTFFKEKFRISCKNSFIWYFRSASTYFPYFRDTTVQRYSHINGIIIVPFLVLLELMLLSFPAAKIWW